MAEEKTIERFLTSNSTMPSSMPTNRLVVPTLKTQYRPDKLFGRDEFMKWDVIYNNIDTPHRMPRGKVLAIMDRTELRTQLNDLKDFKI